MGRHLLILFFLFPALPVFADEDLRGLYETLDSLVRIQSQMVEQKERHIGSIRRTLQNKNLASREVYEINERLYEEYAAFNYDSASIYVGRNISLARKMKDTYLYNICLIHKVHILSVSGLFEEASDLLKTIRQNELKKEDLILYYKLFDDLYLYKAEYTEKTKYSEVYIKIANSYRLRILDIAPPGTPDYVFAKASYLSYKNQIDAAIKVMEEFLPSLDSGSREYSIATSTLAYFYGVKKNSFQQKKYFILSAVSDLKACIRETNSIRELAAILYREGDIDRAYRYLNVSINDANFYNTRLRNIQASKLIPLITGTYQKKQASQHKLLVVLLFISAMIVVILVVGLIFIAVLMKRFRRANRKIYRFNKELNKAVDALKDMNERQDLTNRELKESNKIKEEYLGRFLDLCSTYIDKFDNYRRTMNKLAMNHKLPELFAGLNNDRLTNESTECFYQNFDSAFLKIYPNFVTEANKLLQPEDRIVPKQDGHLTTELRIFALIRLGITDSRKIANILRSSITTIYTYRSKIKNRSIFKNDFENKIMEIDSYLDIESNRRQKNV